MADKRAREHREFVAAEPTCDLDRVRLRLETFADCCDDGVTGRVTEGVIDAFEVVAIDEQKRSDDLSPGGVPGEDMLDAVVEPGAAGQTCQLVVTGRVESLLLTRRSLARDVKHRQREDPSDQRDGHQCHDDDRSHGAEAFPSR